MKKRVPDATAQEEAARAGAAGYLAKPFPGTALLDLIRKAIEPSGPGFRAS